MYYVGFSACVSEQNARVLTRFTVKRGSKAGSEMDITFVTYYPIFLPFVVIILVQSSPVTAHFFTKYRSKLRLGFAISTTGVWFNVLIGKVSFAISKTSTPWPLCLYQRENLLKIKKKTFNSEKNVKHIEQRKVASLHQCRVAISYRDKGCRCNFSGSTALYTPYVLLEEFPAFNLSMNTHYHRQCNALSCNQN